VKEPPRRKALAAALALAAAAGLSRRQKASAASSTLRRPDVKLPRVLVGCWQLLERYPTEEAALETLMKYAEAGFTAFDTADIYGPSESLLGRFRSLYASRFGSANDLQIFTKYVPVLDSSRETAQQVNDASRAALGMPSLDMVQYCWYGPFLDDSHLQPAFHLRELQREGKIKYLAGCNYDTPHLNELVSAGIPIVANQVQFSLLDLRPENGMLEFCQANGIQLLCFGTVAGGWLSDKYLGAPPPLPLQPLLQGTASSQLYYQSLQAWASPLTYLSPFGWSLYQDLLQTLRAVADKHGSCIANVATAWVQRRLDDTCGGGVIVGVRDASHLGDLKALASLRLDDSDMQKIRDVLNRGAPPAGDVWDRERLPGPITYSVSQSWPVFALPLAQRLQRLLTK